MKFKNLLRFCFGGRRYKDANVLRSLPTQLTSKFHSQELAILRKIFEGISDSERHDRPILTKEGFISFVQLNGYWGYRLYCCFDTSNRGFLTFTDFIEGIAHAARGTTTQKHNLMFKMFDINQDGLVQISEMVTMLSHMPEEYYFKNPSLGNQHQTSDSEEEFLSHERDNSDNEETTINREDSMPNAMLHDDFSLNKCLDDFSEEASHGLQRKSFAERKHPNHISTPKASALLEQDVPNNNECVSMGIDSVAHSIFEKYQTCNIPALTKRDFVAWLLTCEQDLMPLILDQLYEPIWGVDGDTSKRASRKDITSITPLQFHFLKKQVFVTGRQTQGDQVVGLLTKQLLSIYDAAPYELDRGDHLEFGKNLEHCSSCPQCHKPFFLCVKCNRGWPELVLHDKKIYLECRLCDGDAGSRTDNCWFCDFQFNQVYNLLEWQSGARRPVFISTDNGTMFIKESGQVVQEFLFLYKNADHTLPSEVLFLPNYVLKTKANSRGFTLYPANKISKARTIHVAFTSDHDRKLWERVIKNVCCKSSSLDNYVIKGVLGRGRSSVVYRCLCNVTGEQYAIKIYNLAPLTHTEQCMILKEVSMLRLLKHENIISMYDSAQSEGKLHIWTEYVAGGSLDRYIKQGVGLPEDIVQKLMAQTISGLKYLHACGVVHRDIKPANIVLVNSQISQPKLKIADFGLATLCGPNQSLIHRCGTYGYSAPELEKGLRYGKEIDIWSLGVTFFQLLTGCELQLNGIYDRNNIELHLSKSFHGRATSPAAKNLLLNMLNEKPQKRITAAAASLHLWITSPSASCGN